MSKTVWINGMERLIGDKDRYGTYHIYLDDKDIKWLNNSQKVEEATKRFLQGLLKLKVHKIKNKEYILSKDIGRLSDKTFGKIKCKAK